MIFFAEHWTRLPLALNISNYRGQVNAKHVACDLFNSYDVELPELRLFGWELGASRLLLPPSELLISRQRASQAYIRHVLGELQHGTAPQCTEEVAVGGWWRNGRACLGENT